MTPPLFALVTGASAGIGAEFARQLAAEGNGLVLTARRADRLEALATELRAKHAIEVHCIPCDLADPRAPQQLFDECARRGLAVDVLVNNAGYGDVDSVEDATLEDFRRQIDANLFGTIIMTKAAIPVMREQRSGHIIQFSSVGGRIGAPGRAPYSAAKWAIEGFSESLAREMALIGVHVSVIEPGGFRTDFAGSSTTLNEGRPEYDAVVGATARAQRLYNGQQPGDPRRAGQAIVKLASLDQPPFRLPLGSDALKIIEQADLAKLEELERWRELSASTDFPR